MRFTEQTAAAPGTISRLDALYLADERQLVRELADTLDRGDDFRKRVEETAGSLVRALRSREGRPVAEAKRRRAPASF